ncbi:hypothetical protein VW35_01045 [Devosia soli]|uniref:DUF551 domain-containing protein n=1 Tax=Devosia soli TaxID=361041 RepID=A0A0F5LEK6_9HYPH|nr:hypothetical protein [Devosia soli]KKB80826.1 hypothetical protein VW35_01045 [Devosia soli]
MSSETVSNERLAEMLEAFTEPAKRFGANNPEYDLALALRELQSLRSKPVASGVEVKPLEWEQVGRRGKRVYRAETAFADYQVDCYEDSDGPGWEAFYGDVHELGCFATEQEAKAAAEADYRNRIMSVLEPATAPVGWQPRRKQAVRLAMPTASEFVFALHPTEDDALMDADECRPLYASPQPQPKAVTDGWQTMDTAPLDGKHCILAVKEPGGFVYSVQGAFQAGQWSAVHRDNVDPIFWKPNVRLPEGWESAKPFSALEAAMKEA